MDEDLESALLADFGSDEDESQEEMEVTEEVTVEDKEMDQEVPKTNGHQSNQEFKHESIDDATKLDILLKGVNEKKTIEKILGKFDITTIYDVTKDSKIAPLIPYLQGQIAKYSSEEESDYHNLLASISQDGQSSEEYSFILKVNDITQVINDEIAAIDSFIKMHYKVVFSELESLVANAVDYASIVLVLKQNLNDVGRYQDDLKRIVSNEKVLVITMSALQQQKSQHFELDEYDFNMICKACGLILQLNSIQRELSQFTSSKLSKFAPNVCAIVGPITSAQLLTAAGSLRQLSITPSCNLPSLGIRDLSSERDNLVAKSRNVRQTGYLFHSDLVKHLPEDVMKPAMRMISGKVVLAARIDLAQSCASGSIGSKYLEEINKKIDKLLTPPENQADKALPIPIEQKSKKRAGRRFRKMKQRFEMSDLRKAQNKMAFGQQEDSIMDSFGEEIGLGMSRGGQGTLNVKMNTNTNAKMSKGMAARLKTNNTREDIESLVFARPSQSPIETTTITRPINTKETHNESKWFTGMKRKREENE
ncbi:pre-mRNA-processing factor 31 [[Candida] anglica]|uniref:Pre-mRNA-processing factor 31 n=1 Tax=[Candida] anglica TaxID=148631 RepID=A0ABP0EF11_9ASCO